MVTPSAVFSYITHNEELKEALHMASSSSFEVEPLARGEYHENFLFVHPQRKTRFLFRVNLGSQLHLENQISYEAQALTLLAQSGRTPQLRYVDDSKKFEGKGVLVEDFLPGRPLCYKSDTAEAAAILADVHSVALPPSHGLLAPKNPLRNMVEECRSLYERYCAWDDADKKIITRLARWFEWVEARVQQYTPGNKRHIISTELNARNFLINTSQPSFLVDWEKPLAAEAEQDIAHFLVPTTTCWKTEEVLTEESRVAFMRKYCQAVGERFDTAEVSRRVEYYLAVTCLRGITWSAMALAQHKTGERSVADAYTLCKIETFLSEDFLSMIEKSYYAQCFR